MSQSILIVCMTCMNSPKINTEIMAYIISKNICGGVIKILILLIKNQMATIVIGPAVMVGWWLLWQKRWRDYQKVILITRSICRILKICVLLYYQCNATMVTGM